MFPPGRPRLVINPSATGSATSIMTVGTRSVASRAALDARFPTATMTSTFRLTSRLAIYERRTSPMPTPVISKEMLRSRLAL